MADLSKMALEAATSEYRSRGHAVLRRVLDSKELEKVRQSVIRRLKRTGVTDGALTNDGQLRFIKSDEEDPHSLVLDEASALEALESCFQESSLVKAVGDIIGCSEVFSHPVKWLRAVPPSDSDLSYPAGVHQDYMELQGSPNQLTMWAPLFPVTEDTGSLPVYDTGGQRHVMPMRVADNPSGWEVDPVVLGPRSAYDLAPGDVVVFNTFTPHGGSVNRGRGIRVSIESRYQPLQDPISATYLDRPILRENWEAHYEGWTGPWAHYWRDRHPTAVPFDDTWERWRDVVAVNEGLRGNIDALPALGIASQFGRNAPLRELAADLYAKILDADG